MTLNCVNIGREEESLNIANINPDRKKPKTKQANYALQHVRADSQCMWMKSVSNLS